MISATTRRTVMPNTLRARTCSGCDQLVDHPAQLERVGRSWLRLCDPCRVREARAQAIEAEEAAELEATELRRWVERVNAAAERTTDDLSDHQRQQLDKSLARYGSPRVAAAARARLARRRVEAR
jgi:hypothetical protein